MVATGQSATSLLGLPAVQLGELGEGRFVVISPNLEVNAGDRGGDIFTFFNGDFLRFHGDFLGFYAAFTDFAGFDVDLVWIWGYHADIMG